MDGADGFRWKQNQRYSPEQKQQAVKEYLSGKGSLCIICKKYRITDRKVLRRWIQVYNAH